MSFSLSFPPAWLSASSRQLRPDSGVPWLEEQDPDLVSCKLEHLNILEFFSFLSPIIHHLKSIPGLNRYLKIWNIIDTSYANVNAQQSWGELSNLSVLS